jgi:uncharacterized protein with NRDE domain
MCLILIAWHAHPDYPLVVAANRDEFFARPTAAAGFWVDAPSVLAGRDLEAGGTWMGITRTGRFAALTNFRDPAQHRPDAPSRGHLVADFLRGTDAPAAYLERIAPIARRCNGFNLLLSDGESLWWSASTGDAQLRVKLLTPGVYGVSNHLLDTPWPKVDAGKTALAAAITRLPDDLGLFELLTNEAIHPDEELPETGVGLEWERLLSSAFVKGENHGYGTCCSTVAWFGADGSFVFDEQSWLPGAQWSSQRGSRSRFSIQPQLNSGRRASTV